MADKAWHEAVLPVRWPDAAAALEKTGVTEGFYLAGGTGLALQLGHRTSIDLDLFTPRSFNARSVRDALRHTPEFAVQQIADNTLHAEIATVQVSFLTYTYPLQFQPRQYRQLTVADVRDIAGMKLDALSSRGTRRDFIDLYMVLRDHSMRDVLGWFDAKYASAAPNRVHLAKALTYFADAEADPMPHMLVPVDWAQIKSFFETQVRQYLQIG